MNAAAVYFDEETHLHENHNRFYDASLGIYLQLEPMLGGPVAGPREVYTAPLPRRSMGGPKFIASMAKRGQGAPVYGYALNNPLHFVDSTGLDPDVNSSNQVERQMNKHSPQQSSSTNWGCWSQCMNETFDGYEPGSVGDATAATCVGGIGSALTSEWFQLIGVHYGGRAGMSAASGTVLGLRAAGIGGAVTTLGFGVACSMACTK